MHFESASLLVDKPVSFVMKRSPAGDWFFRAVSPDSGIIDILLEAVALKTLMMITSGCFLLYGFASCSSLDDPMTLFASGVKTVSVKQELLDSYCKVAFVIPARFHAFLYDNDLFE